MCLNPKRQFPTQAAEPKVLYLFRSRPFLRCVRLLAPQTPQMQLCPPPSAIHHLLLHPAMGLFIYLFILDTVIYLGASMETASVINDYGSAEPND